MNRRKATGPQGVTLEIGTIIKEKLMESDHSVVWLAEQLGCSRTNIYKMFNRQTIGTNELLKISKALSFDFFGLYSELLGRHPRKDS